VRAVLDTTTTDAAKGGINGDMQTFTISANDQLTKPEQFDQVIIAYRNGAPVRVRDVGHAITGPQDVNQGALNGVNPSVLLLIYKQPGANVINTVDSIKAAMPRLARIAPPGLKVDTIADRTQTIRASVQDVEITLAITIALVVMVILLFLRDLRATLIPSVAVPLALLGSIGLMYLFGFSLDNLSLMALTISVGFVVDDAIVVVENIYRHIESGTSPMSSALQGASEIGFTVLSISISLVAVFIPLLLMGGIIGRLFREFAITVTAAIAVSVVVSLTLTPMLSSRFLSAQSENHGRVYRAIESAFEALVGAYRRGLDLVLRHQALTLMAFFATMAMTALLFLSIPKGFFPTQDTGVIQGIAYAAQDVSPDRMRGIQRQLSQIIGRDPDIVSFGSFFGNGGGNTLNTSRFFIALKPRDERKATAVDVINRLRPQLAEVAGATLFLQPSQDITVGGRISSGQYQYTLQDSDFEELNTWAPRMLAKLKTLPAQDLAGIDRCVQRPAGQCAAPHGGDKPGCCRAFRDSGAGGRRHAERCLRPERRNPILHAGELLFRHPRNTA
jgi:HAE1 family hydrophobic/amphiphilic exporter-1